MISKITSGICLVGIAKDEEKFLDEWLVYHKMLGIDHFVLYDNSPELPLKKLLKFHSEYVTVIPWTGDLTSHNQLDAYRHAAANYILAFEWVIFLDVDEFIVLRQHSNLSSFLSEFQTASAISLNWHVFGHNGYYDDPEILITSALTRRMFMPSIRVKTFTKVKDILEITSPHHCKLKSGIRVDANNHSFKNEIYLNKTVKAHINHYQCRSFSRWVGRATRGDANFNQYNCPPEQLWRLSYESCLKQFVTTVALNKNEYVDEFLQGY
ncbi:MAG: glycosyltransferase family 92 protein [Mucilaginibacter sp.]|uniref:glycosyltransferase family 92 protein n=1 Tax=Mucilaginibacter sp. TaxID=1882438 RepID=UPI0032656CFB